MMSIQNLYTLAFIHTCLVIYCAVLFSYLFYLYSDTCCILFGYLLYFYSDTYSISIWIPIIFKFGYLFFFCSNFYNTSICIPILFLFGYLITYSISIRASVKIRFMLVICCRVHQYLSGSAVTKVHWYALHVGDISRVCTAFAFMKNRRTAGTILLCVVSVAKECTKRRTYEVTWQAGTICQRISAVLCVPGSSDMSEL